MTGPNPQHADPALRKLLAAANRDPDGVRRRVQAARAERSLRRFVEFMWPTVEPARPFVPGFHVDAICEHLEAVSNGEIKRLLVNVPPGTSKSLLTNVFFPAFEWITRPQLRYLCFSYSQNLTIRDNVRFRQIILSPEYREFWGNSFERSEDQFSLITVANDKSGFKVASSLGGTATGLRSERLILDDPNNAAEAESEIIREGTNTFFREVLPSRLANPSEGAIIVIQQRVHDRDVSGLILESGMDFEHLMIPMLHDGSPRTTSIGWSDPRCFDPKTAEFIGNEGALMWPAMYPQEVVEGLQRDLGPHAFAGQYQQSPVPREGNIFELSAWKDWPPPDDIGDQKWISSEGKIIFPQLDYIVAAVDTAYTEKESNDYSAMVVLGVFRGAGSRMASPKLQRGSESDPVEYLRLVHDDRPKVVLLHAWQKRLTIHGPPEIRPTGVTDKEWNSPEWKAERSRSWGLVEWVTDTCRRYKVDHLLIETQAAGHTLEQELRRLNSDYDWGVEMLHARTGKVERAWAVQHLFSNGLVYAPLNPVTGLRPQWAENCLNEMSRFPKGKNDDQCDAAVYALQHLRDSGILVRGEEFDSEGAAQLLPPPKRGSLYEV